jgi:hypothetical protein
MKPFWWVSNAAGATIDIYRDMLIINIYSAALFAGNLQQQFAERLRRLGLRIMTR